jgi:hypothetical protein
MAKKTMPSIEEQSQIDNLLRSYHQAAKELNASWDSSLYRAKFFDALNRFYASFQKIQELTQHPGFEEFRASTLEAILQKHEDFVNQAQHNLIKQLEEIKKDFQKTLQRFEHAHDHEIYYTYADDDYPRSRFDSLSAYHASIEMNYNSDFSHEKDDFLKIKNNVYFKEVLNNLAFSDTFQKLTRDMEDIFDKILSVQDKTKKQIQQLKLLPHRVKVVLSLIKHSQAFDENDLITSNVLKYLPSIIACLEKEKDTEGNPLCTQEQLKAAQNRIYKIIHTASFPLKVHHAGRIMIACLLAIVLTPASLILTIPWIIKRKKDTVIEQRIFRENDYAELEQHGSGVESEKQGLFNRQHELRKVVKSKSGTVKILMRSEQAIRLDGWIARKNNSKQNKLLPNESFFTRSKTREKATIEKRSKALARSNFLH